MAALALIILGSSLFLVKRQRLALERQDAAAFAAALATATARALPQATAAPAVAPGGQSPQATAAPTRTPAVTVRNVLPASSPLSQEIHDALKRYWDVYGAALYDLDTSRLHEVAAGEELQRATGQVETIKAEGEAMYVDLDHLTFVFDANDSRAYVLDKVTERSYALDAVTKQPVGTEQGTSPIRPSQKELIYVFERIDGVWKVTRLSRAVPQ